MKYETAYDVFEAICNAYYIERNIEAFLACVTEDIQWIGTEKNFCATGKEAVKALLQTDLQMFKDSLNITIDPPQIKNYGDQIASVWVKAHQECVPGLVGATDLRATFLMVNTDAGWLASQIHVSAPNTSMEKYSLEKKIDEDREKEKLLLAGIPGGVAIYRLKKNGKISMDYGSEGLANLIGYDSVEKMLDYLYEDTMRNVVEEDRQIVFDAVEKSMANNEPISAIYRIHVRNQEDVLIRLDAQKIDSEIGEDDVCAWYAVHTMVSAASKKIIQEYDNFLELINEVPVGIGVYELRHGKLLQVYMNEAFYDMIGSTRDKRKQYHGGATIQACHPDDWPKLKAAIADLTEGADKTVARYRIKTDDGKWFWISMVACVAERSKDYIKIYTSLSDYNAVVAAQREIKHAQDLNNVALDTAKILAWCYDYRTDTITNSSTLGDAYNLPKVIKNASVLIRQMLSTHNQEQLDILFETVQQEKKVAVEVLGEKPGFQEKAWYRLIYTPLFDADGHYTETVGMAVDISEQKNKELHYEEQLRMNQMAAQDAMAKLYVNVTQNRITGYETMSPVFETHKQFTVADDLFSQVVSDVMDQAEVAKFEDIKDCAHIKALYEKGITHKEIRCHTSNHSSWVLVIYDIIENPYTGHLEMISSIHDVTEQVRYETVVAKLLEVDYTSILVIDNKTGIAYPFKQSLDDYKYLEINKYIDAHNNQEMALERFFRKHVVADDIEAVIKANSPETIKEELAVRPQYECTYALNEEGKLKQYKVVYAYLDDNHNMLLSTVQDITSVYQADIQQKRHLTALLKEAESANKAKTTFLSRISHDMRTPLNGILGLTTILKDSITDDNLHQDLIALEQSGKYLLNLINDTLDMSRIESGKLELHPVVCEGRDFFNNTVTLAKTVIQSKKLTYHITTENIPFTVLYDDVARIEQVIMNVVSNAVKFTPEGGNIDVIVKNISVHNGEITDQIIVKDTGIGMSEEFQKHIFEAFSQEDSSRTSSVQGTGLGMAITKQLLEKMGGDISVTSELGKGSCFTITIKLHMASTAQIAAWKKSQIITDKKDYLIGKRILLCEDHPLNAAIATKLLETRGMLVEHAANGQIGVEMFKKSTAGYYDCIIMDIRMPVMDGLDATKTIRSLPRQDARMIPIVAMTANAFNEDVTATQNVGMDAHLSKPIQTGVLYDTLSALMRANYQSDFSRKKILVVDDMDMNREVIRIALEQDYDVVEAENGRQALEILANNQGFDVVITDIQMPVMDGIELIGEIRKNNDYRHLVIIANTQFGNPEQEELILDLGANDFIYKPTTARIVGVRVRNALRRAF